MDIPDFRPICKECKEHCDTWLEDLSFGYSGTHCTWGKPGTYIDPDPQVLSICCDAEVEE